MLASLLFHRGEYQSMYQSMTHVVHVLFSFAREYFRNIRLPKPPEPSALLLSFPGRQTIKADAH
jgi:hypothetical protein